MTEAMSRREIEDVLSSIRRLVAHDPARAQRGSAPTDPGAAASAQGSRHDAPPGQSNAAPETLVLTSALRVNDRPVRSGADADNDAGTAQGEGGAPGPSRSAPAPDGGGLTARRENDIGQAIARHPDDVADDRRANGPTAMTASVTAAPVPRDMGTEDDSPLQQAEYGFTRTRAALAQLQATRDAGPDASLRHPAAHEREDANFPPAADLRPEDPLPSDGLAEDALETTLARLEQALSVTTSAARTDAPAPTDPGLPGQGAAPVQPAAPPLAEDERIIDESTLRQIVADIVRQELQGELGERITRNIRKLVRAEVARELQLRKP